MAALLVFLGVALLALAGFGVSHPRFQPQWLGFALVFLGAFWVSIVAQIH
jgi:drug/metabolite transporter (DMT)-like permease